MLLGNYSVHNRNPLKFLGGSAASPEVNHGPNFARGGRSRNRQCLDQTTAGNLLFSLPSGCYPPYTVLLPQKGGSLSSHRSADFGIAAAATGIHGLPGAGAASLSVSTNEPSGNLIVSGSGESSFSVTANPPLLTASINGAGSASVALAFASPILGAIASLTGAVTVVVTPSNPAMWPLDDASPLRTGAAAMGLTGTLERYALGHMAGSTVDSSDLTPDRIAGAVWGASASDFNTSGTTGSKLNSASAAGDPWTADLPGAYPVGSAGALLGNLVAGLTNDQALQLLELWRMTGLDPSAPLAVTQESRLAGGIAQAIEESGGTVTVTRQ